jgi:hypothetical protein
LNAFHHNDDTVPEFKTIDSALNDLRNSSGISNSSNESNQQQRHSNSKE